MTQDGDLFAHITELKSELANVKTMLEQEDVESEIIQNTYREDKKI